MHWNIRFQIILIINKSNKSMLIGIKEVCELTLNTPVFPYFEYKMREFILYNPWKLNLKESLCMP